MGPDVRGVKGGQGLVGFAASLRRAVQTAVLRVGARVGPGPRIYALDRETFRVWGIHEKALGVALGAETAAAFSETVRAATEIDPRLGRELAASMPDPVAALGLSERKRYFEAMDWVLQERPGEAGRLVRSLGGLLGRLDDEALRRFIQEGARIAEEDPERARAFLGGESEASMRAMQELGGGVSLHAASRLLGLYAQSHCGCETRLLPLSVEPGTHASGVLVGFTDGHDLHLPERVDAFGDERDFLVYRVLVARLAGFLEHGTFDLRLVDEPAFAFLPPRREGETEMERLARGFKHRHLARALFEELEGHRVMTRVRQAYPGIERDLGRVREALPGVLARPRENAVDAFLRALSCRSLGDEGVWNVPEPLGGRALSLLDQLGREASTVVDTALALVELFPLVEALMLRTREAEGGRPWGGSGTRAPVDTGDLLRPERRSLMARLLDEAAWRLLARGGLTGREATLGEVRAALGERGAPTSWEEIDAWLDALPAPGGGVVERLDREYPPAPPKLLEGVTPLTTRGPRSFVYHEWDCLMGDYRPDWVRVTEYPVAAGRRDFVDETLARHRQAVASIRRQFEALRPQEMLLLKGLPDGEDLDVDRVVESIAARRVRVSPPENLYTRHVRSRRDVAVAFLLDLSSSTNERAEGAGQRIIDIEKEALVLIAEALHVIGDAFAVWGFSGHGRDQVAFYVAKSFDEPYGELARERIGGLSWKMENRDGAAIRHATRRLLERPARERLLILLSEGKPLDCGCDRYADRYAQEDARVALMEARKAQIHPFCITVDPEGGDYLARMYGTHGYTVIERVSVLPLRLPRIYRRLTRQS
jgi:hypothetical protein